MKLQKLLYFAQGISFQRFDAALFPDEIEAWDFGPVVNNVYQKYKSYDREPIRDSEDIPVSADEESLLLDVAREYGKYTTWTLVDMTHKKGSPWAECYIEGQNHTVIPKSTIRAYFRDIERPVTGINWDELISMSTVVDLTGDNTISSEDW